MDAKRKALAHEDLRHAKHFRGGVTAGKDLRVSKHDGSGIKPGVLQMLFQGGSVHRQKATDDLRHGRREDVKPATGKMLWKGGQPRALADHDERMGHDGEDEQEPHNLEMLADGGEAGELSSEEKLAAHEAMAALKSGDATKFALALKALVSFGSQD